MAPEDCISERLPTIPVTVSVNPQRWDIIFFNHPASRRSFVKEPICFTLARLFTLLAGP